MIRNILKKKKIENNLNISVQDVRCLLFSLCCKMEVIRWIPQYSLRLLATTFCTNASVLTS